MFLTSSARLFVLVAVSAGLVSCETGSTKSSSSVSDPYVSNYPADGGYNPYPGQPGNVAGGTSSVPSYETPVAPVEADPYAFHGSSSTHTVAKGDTLYGLAIKNKTTVAKIKAANGLSSDLIRPGQKLKLR